MAENGKDQEVPLAEVSKEFRRITGLNTKKPDTCQQCSNPAKYTCPGCQCRSCSMPCVKKHKEDTHCTGVRDKVNYKPMSQLDDLDILNDYRLLEEIGRRVEVAGRTAPKAGRFGSAPPLRPAQHRLRRAAKKRGVRLDFLPEGFERRRLNTTELEGVGHQLLWRVEWRLPLADAVLTDDKVPETRTISEALGRHLSARPAADASEDPLQFYRAASETGSVRVFLQLERVQKGDRYVELSLSKPLSACLNQRLVIEFPILMVTTEEHAERYRSDRIEESFFSLCKQEEEAQRRTRRAARRRVSAVSPAAAGEPSGRKVPRPQLGGASVPAPPQPETERRPAEQQQRQQAESGPHGTERTQPQASKALRNTAAGFGLFGADDSDLSE